uniref:Fibronectin type-III domain-containing protein n=1 Tax=Pygocentrus nattereri TaxID=42514 RepID=A0A3B4DBA7_PYGNA
SKSSLMQALFLILGKHLNIPHHSVDATLLPAPENLSIHSVNMRHLLKWRPLQAACGTVHYSVKFQGEYETHMLNGSWVDAYDCQDIVRTECDLTLDLGSDSDYSIGVQAQCGGQTSWTQLPSTFNRRNTVLVAPNMSVTVTGSLIQVGFSELLPLITINLHVWREGDEQSASSQVIRAQPYHFSFDTQQNGGTHCVRAEVLLEIINKSSSTETHCFSVLSESQLHSVSYAYSYAALNPFKQDLLCFFLINDAVVCC